MSNMDYIEKRGNKYVVMSESGKVLGEYGSRNQAKKRLREIEYFKNKDCQLMDFAPFTGEREITDEGYLAVNVIATSVGVQEYDSSDFGLEAGKTMGLYRTPETVFSDETIESFTGRPVTIGHDGAMIDVNTHKVYSVGNAMGDAFPLDGKKLGIRILITDPDTVRRVQDGELTGVSLGYACEQELKRGSYDGTRYDAVTKGPMLINHVTLLPKSMPPRVKEARILDSDKSKKEIVMDEELKAEIAAMIAEALSGFKADMAKEAEKADMEEEKEDSSDMEEKSDADDEKTDADDEKEDMKEEKADSADNSDKADAKMDSAKIDAAIAEGAAKRAQVLALCDSPMATESNEDLLKAKLGDDFVNVDQAIGYLQAVKKLDTADRQKARDTFDNASSGAAVYDLNDIKGMEG